ncbi:MAG: ATP-binding cassette domain-containing protein [Alphaproteobacteria bacterium]|nr:ATP-binding cassette domain-containing protein [Alphaproteobacteria bacterium]
MLELHNIKAGYDARRMVLHDVSAVMRQRAVTVIMGPNGAGKSTMLRVMYGLLKSKAGTISLHGEKLQPRPQNLVEEGIFMVPQGTRVFRTMTVLENLELATHFWPSRAGFDKKLKEVLEHFPDLTPRLHDMAGNLSGGQQQMVALARVLINNPKLVFLDEPSIGLSPKLIQDIFKKIRTLCDQTGAGFVVVEHNLKTLLPLVDYAYILEQGRVVYDGLAEGKALDKMLAATFKA